MAKQHFIIIDDDVTFREILSRSLSKLDCEVANFPHPKEALPLIKNYSTPEDNLSDSQLVILLDLKLESDSGLRWISKIKAENQNAYLLLLTGYASISTAVEAIKLGADDYLSKPITARDILNHLEKQDSDPEIPIRQTPMSVGRLEWEHIQRVLQENEGNISASARALGMHRRTLQRKLSKKPARN